ncbi:ANTAR domain-containing protein [Arthrobacter antioxidans]|uniref:ANTAR domain-containing protein n=1 Tax=Arthrobacter antioxidans TaxID=2895818 RepID=UPI001FFFA652|nr:ANTAR domain-containing protein [Arthrobacter antioxidans]
MGRAGLDATDAFARLNSHSQRANRKVVVIAQEIIDRAVTLTHREHRHDHDLAPDRALQELFRACDPPITAGPRRPLNIGRSPLSRRGTVGSPAV